jgi:hypothetical protein
MSAYAILHGLYDVLQLLGRGSIKGTMKMHRTAKSSHRMYESSQMRIFFIAAALCSFAALANPATAAPGASPCRGGKTQYQPDDRKAVWTNDVDCNQIIFSKTTVQIGKDAGSTGLDTYAHYNQGLPEGSGVFVVLLTAEGVPLGSIWFGRLKAADCTNETLNRTADPATAPPGFGLFEFDDPDRLRKAASVELFFWHGSYPEGFTKC